MTTILSLGGSLICPDKVDVEFLKSFRDMVLDYVKEGHRFIIICGGGRVCRDYQNAASGVTKVSQVDNDWVGIASTKLNAELVRAIFSEHAYESVYGNPEEKVETDKPIIIGAGYLPGHSSDMDAVLIAETFGAKQLINMSNIKKVYTDDPKKNPDAKPIDKVNWDEFLNIIGEEWVPGRNVPFDPNASKKAKELGLNVAILDGKDLDNLKQCIEEKEFTGTLIRS